MKKAFTMMELIFVLIVIGILAAVILPEMRSNKLREAAIQVISHIRYTQHLAMVDDKFDSSDSKWYRGRWQIVFTNTTIADPISYSIFSDKPDYTGKADASEVARDPMSSDRFLSGGSSSISQDHALVNKKLNLGNTYNITGFNMADGCKNQTRLTFDHLGRPIQGTIHGLNKPYENGKLLTSQCKISLCEGPCSGISSDTEVIIAIEPETGYAHIVD